MSSKKIKKRLVVVTGASTGIGCSIAKELADKGFKVIAGVRKQSDVVRLKSLNNSIKPIYLDVTRKFDVDNLAYEINTEHNGELFALINNAGVMHPGPIELVSMNQIREEMEVNYFGVVSVTKKLLNNIRNSMGRVINISSMNGKLSMPAFSGYSASKFALEAFSDALRMEVFNSGVKVSLIEPGQVRTTLFNKALDLYNKLKKNLNDSDIENYNQLLNALEGAMNAGMYSNTSPELVASFVYDILTSDDPQPRYIIGEDAKQFLSLKASMTDEALDMQILTAFGLLKTQEKVEVTQ